MRFGTSMERMLAKAFLIAKKILESDGLENNKRSKTAMIFSNIGIEQLEKRKIILFGAGKAAENFLERQKDILRRKYICFVDNNTSKCGTYKNVCNRDIYIMSISELLEMDQKDVFLIITNNDFFTVRDQLETEKKLKNTEYSFYQFMEFMDEERKEQKRKYPASFRISEDSKIPKKIHYCWFGGKEMPLQNRKWIESWKKYCPNYEIIEWNEKNYDLGKNIFLKTAYENKMWGFVPDYVRLDVIYHWGGIYLDVDVELIRSLDELLYQDGYVGVEDNGLINLGNGFGSKKENFIIKDLMGLYENREMGTNVSPTASPSFEKEFWLKKGYHGDGNYQKIDNMTVLPKKVLCPKSYRTGICVTSEYTFSIHHYDGSWITDKSKKKRNEIIDFYQKQWKTEHKKE